MKREPITMFCYMDISGQVRGKGFPTRLLERRLDTGIAWTPTNIMFTCLGTIADSPWGAFGDLVFMPDRKAEAHVEFGDGSANEHFFLCDVLHTDRRPWECCPRTLLRTAVEALREEGVALRVAFEHEFIYSGANSRTGDGYALDGLRRHGTFGEIFLGALEASGIHADSYLPEFAPGQFEVTFPPVDPVKAADQAIILRELARGTAQRLGHNVTFTPRLTPEGLGSGVHIHMSLWDLAGKPISHDPAGPAGVSKTAGHFLAGVLRHMPALCAFTAPTPVSYLRLVPHTWAAAWSNIGYRDREAGIRICPTFDTSEKSTAEQFNFEYRAADASANPYIQLAVILRAGLEGLRGKLPLPKPTDKGAEALSEAERKRRGIRRLPGSLPAALKAVDDDVTVQGFFPPLFLEAYRRNKQAELKIGKAWPVKELCRRYAEVY